MGSSKEEFFCCFSKTFCYKGYNLSPFHSMQLFYTPFVQQNDHVLITEPRVLDQLRKVLRAQDGYQFYVQDESVRIFCQLE